MNKKQTNKKTKTCKKSAIAWVGKRRKGMEWVKEGVVIEWGGRCWVREEAEKSAMWVINVGLYNRLYYKKDHSPDGRAVAIGTVWQPARREWD